MALQASALENDLKSIFKAMADGSKDDDWLAAQMATVITNQIKTAAIASGSVIVTVTGGSGAPAVGVPNTTPIGVQ